MRLTAIVGAIADRGNTQMLIQKLRLQKGWSQEQLAEVSGLSVRTVQRLERGHPGSLESMNALAAVFEIDLNALKEPDMPATTTTDHHAAAHLPADEALALARVRKLRGFYVHLTQYVVIIGVLAAVNIITYHHFLWFIFPALGWGVALLAHGASLFGLPFLGADWERRQVEKHLGRKL